MNRQEVYNTVAKHLLTQGVRSAITDDKGLISCRYRGPNNTKCAIGCLINDDEYTPEIEGAGVRSLIYYIPIRLAVLKDINGADLSFLSELQTLHDSCEPDHWQIELQDFASDHGLVPYKQ